MHFAHLETEFLRARFAAGILAQSGGEPSNESPELFPWARTAAFAERFSFSRLWNTDSSVVTFARLLAVPPSGNASAAMREPT
jgi:hypothetical protein